MHRPELGNLPGKGFWAVPTAQDNFMADPQGPPREGKGNGAGSDRSDLHRPSLDARLSAALRSSPFCDNTKSRPSRGRGHDLQAMPQNPDGLPHDVEPHTMAVAGSAAHAGEQIKD